MTEREIGTFTIPIRLAVTAAQRRRLEHAVRVRRVDPADLLSALIAGLPPRGPLATSQPLAQISMRVYLTAAERDAVVAYAQTHELEVSQVVSAMASEQLDQLADPPAADPQPDQEAARRQSMRRELTRLEAYRTRLHDRVPAWLDSYIASLEAGLRPDG
jgi:hypothetical protein